MMACEYVHFVSYQTNSVTFFGEEGTREHTASTFSKVYLRGISSFTPSLGGDLYEIPILKISLPPNSLGR